MSVDTCIIYPWLCVIYSKYSACHQSDKQKPGLTRPAGKCTLFAHPIMVTSCAHNSFTFLFFAKNVLMQTWCCVVVQLTHVLLSCAFWEVHAAAAAAVLRCYLIARLSVWVTHTSDHSVMRVFLPSGLQRTEFILHLPFLINSRHKYVELLGCFYLGWVKSRVLALSNNFSLSVI